jgi:hypothetical protein
MVVRQQVPFLVDLDQGNLLIGRCPLEAHLLDASDETCVKAETVCSFETAYPSRVRLSWSAGRTRTCECYRASPRSISGIRGYFKPDGSTVICSSALNIIKLLPLASSLELSPPVISPAGLGCFLHPHLRQLPIEKRLLVPVQVPNPGVPESIRCHPGRQIEAPP